MLDMDRVFDVIMFRKYDKIVTYKKSVNLKEFRDDINLSPEWIQKILK